MTQMPQTVGNVAYTYVQDAEPSSPAEGETWYDTGANAAYVWDGAAWIEETVTELTNLSDVSGVNSLTEDTQANRPSAGTEGRIYIESDTGRVLYDDGTNWIGVGESAHGDLSGISSNDHHAKTVQRTLNGFVVTHTEPAGNATDYYFPSTLAGARVMVPTFATNLSSDWSVILKNGNTDVVTLSDTEGMDYSVSTTNDIDHVQIREDSLNNPLSLTAVIAEL